MPQIAQSAWRRQSAPRHQSPGQDLCAKPRSFEDVKNAELMCFVSELRWPRRVQRGNAELRQISVKGRRARALLPIWKNPFDVTVNQSLFEGADCRPR